MKSKILVINPGSTSTKVALFDNEICEEEANLVHPIHELNNYIRVIDQLPYRMKALKDWMENRNIDLDRLRAIVGRGGLLRPLPGGTYIVDERMVHELEGALHGQHASNLGAIMAKRLGDDIAVPSYIVDPVVVDEFHEIARISGMPELQRRCRSHALNIKAAARDTAAEIGKPLEETAFVIAHMGGGMSIAALQGGRIIDVNDANEGGPYSPDRAGSLPVGPLIKLAFSQEYTYDELRKKINGKGGLAAYLGTNDGLKIEERIHQGDEYAKTVYEGMAYQIAKEIGAMAAVLKGEINGIILTGGLAYSEMINRWIIQRTQFIAQVYVKPGAQEMEALYRGALRVLEGKEKGKVYEKEVLENDSIF